jgi:hypothetical protein
MVSISIKVSKGNFVLTLSRTFKFQLLIRLVNYLQYFLFSYKPKSFLLHFYPLPLPTFFKICFSVDTPLPTISSRPLTTFRSSFVSKITTSSTFHSTIVSLCSLPLFFSFVFICFASFNYPLYSLSFYFLSSPHRIHFLLTTFSFFHSFFPNHTTSPAELRFFHFCNLFPMILEGKKQMLYSFPSVPCQCQVIPLAIFVAHCTLLVNIWNMLGFCSSLICFYFCSF